MRNITAEELAALQHDSANAPRLLDVREPWEFDVCRLDGSLNIPMNEISERAGELDPDAATVVICRHGARSLHVGGCLEDIGFKEVLNLDGGIAAWAERVDQDMPRY